ncbi:blastula protease 10-like [Lytechinus pictus]|uniref:blastula protease 10-like n=1 Tax=Lytechinus pictus TaxID=7653 RepID=UPI0030BA1FBA
MANMEPMDIQNNDTTLFEGDIKLTEEQREYINNARIGGAETRTKRKAAIRLYNIWETKQVPYFISSGINEIKRTRIEEVIAYMQEETCIQFNELGDPGQHFGSYLNFISDSGCYSYIGRLSGQVNTVSIGDGCETFGIVFHEVCHALSFFHEQSRPDRDDYVTIIWDNIQSGSENNFNMYDTSLINTYGIPYDTESIMHYSSTAFSIDPNYLDKHDRRPTIVTVDPLEMPYLGNRVGPTHSDLKLLNLVYSCSDSCEPDMSCMNGGYLNKLCACTCPPRYTGVQCESDIGDSNDARCIITKTVEDGLTGSITSPGYPLMYDSNTLCQYLITVSSSYCTVEKITILHYLDP